MSTDGDITTRLTTAICEAAERVDTAAKQQFARRCEVVPRVDTRGMEEVCDDVKEEDVAQGIESD